MTGFGRGEAPCTGGAATAEVRTVNSRHLDLRLRLPRELSALDALLRAEAAPFFARGQVELQVRIPAEAEHPARVEVDRDVARLYGEAAASLREELGLGGDLDISTLLALPGVVHQLEPEPATDELAAAVLAAASAAFADAAEMRRREGEALERDFGARLERVAELIGEIEAQASEVASGIRERLQRRIAQLAPELEVDPSRLDQEIVLAADRMDVTEEVVRLRSHAEQFRETLGLDEPVGRKLEFLLQEMGREANTIGSKAQAAKVSSRVVELKTEIEKIREQVLNVE
jgi:uncharacterized protein (TIGR00255 family)